MATSTVEDYLKQIFLEQQRSPADRVGMGKIAEALDLTPGTVTAMMKTLAGSGLVDYEPYSGVTLTDSGRQLALHVLRRHRLIELFLVQIMGMDWSEVHPEAEQLEHVLSDRLVERIDDMLGRPSVDPHGDPIPTAGGEVAEPELTRLSACAAGDSVRVARISDQSAAFLRLVEREGWMPGSRLAVLERDDAADSMWLESEDGRRSSLGSRAAAKILVEPEDARSASAGGSARRAADRFSG